MQGVGLRTKHNFSNLEDEPLQLPKCVEDRHGGGHHDDHERRRRPAPAVGAAHGVDPRGGREDDEEHDPCGVQCAVGAGRPQQEDAQDDDDGRRVREGDRVEEAVEASSRVLLPGIPGFRHSRGRLHGVPGERPHEDGGGGDHRPCHGLQLPLSGKPAASELLFERPFIRTRSANLQYPHQKH